MVRKKKGLACLMAVAAMFSAKSTWAALNIVPVSSSNYQAYDSNAAIGGNLILKASSTLGTVTAPTDDSGFTSSGFYDGIASGTNAANLAYFDNGSAQLTASTPPTYIFNLNTSSANGSTGGYNISTIQSIAGWTDSGIGNQNFDVFYSLVATPTSFVQLGGDYKNAPFGSAVGATMTTINSSTGGYIATGVAAIEFKLLSPGATQGGSGGTVYRDVSVVGTAVGGITFDANTSTPGAQDGGGSWNTTAVNFYNPATGTDQLWGNTTSNVATFGNGSAAGSAGVITVGNVTSNAIQFATTTGSFNLTGGTITLGGTNPTITTNNATATIGSNISSTSLYTAGTGNLTLTGAVTLSAVAYVQAGTLTIAGAGSITSSNLIGVGGNASTVGTLNINTTGTLSFSSAGTTAINTVGSQAGGLGLVNQTSGTVNLGGNLALGYIGTSSGTYNLTGTGVLNVAYPNPGIVVGWGGTGSFYQSGATSLNDAGYFYIGGNNSGTNSSGVATFSGGTAYLGNNSGGAYATNIGFSSNATGVMNIGTQAGGNAMVTVVNGGINVGNAAGATAILNLNSGTLEIDSYFVEKIAGTTTSIVNMNGGTLRAGSSAVSTLFNNTSSPTLNVYNGGLTVDTDGNSVSIAVPLANTGGNGVYPAGGTIAPSATATGLTGSPIVTVSGGGGTGLTAIADVSGGTLTNFELTSPGQNYSQGQVLTFTISGAGASGTTTFTHTLTASDLKGNGTGGLTKVGAGVLMLSAVNTYGGATSVNAGTLALGVNNAIASSSPIILANGTSLLTGGYNQSMGSLTQSGGTTIDFGSNNIGGTVQFASSASQTWAGVLTIMDWNGTGVTGGGPDELKFGSTSGGLTSAQLSDIKFYGYSSGATILSSGEVVPLSTVHTATGVPTIMPLGDSITYGQSGNNGTLSYPGGYRDPLYSALHAVGYAFNFVGSENSNSTTQLSSANESLQEGHSGYKISDLAANINTWLSGTNKAGNVLLMIGTNDIATQYDPSPSGNGVAADAATRLISLINQIYSDSPGATVVVASIIPILSTTDYSSSRWSPALTAEVGVYNALIQSEVIPQIKAEGQTIYFADINSAFLNANGTPNVSLFGTNDDEHPGPSGYAAMAPVWSNVILETSIFGAAGAGQTATFGTSVGPGSLTVTLTQAQTIGTFALNGSAGNGYTLADASNSVLTLNNSGGAANITVNAGTQALNIPIALTAGVNVNVSGGSLTFGGAVTGSGPFTLTTGAVTIATTGSIAVPLVTNGSLTFANNSGGVFTVRSVPSLNITGGTVTVAAAPNLASRQVLSVGSVSFAGTTGALIGQLDLSNNALVAHGPTLTTINSQVAQGYNGGSWNNSGGIVSSTAAADSTHLTALGVIVNDNGSSQPFYGSGGTIASSFDGAFPVDGDILVKYTYYGDSNLDGKVDGTDYSRIDAAVLANQLHSGSMTGWLNGDFNYDGVIDGSDYTLLDNAYNTQGTQISNQIAVNTSQIAPGVAAVPEPATLGICAIALLGMLGRRRRVS